MPAGISTRPRVYGRRCTVCPSQPRQRCSLTSGLVQRYLPPSGLVALVAGIVLLIADTDDSTRWTPTTVGCAVSIGVAVLGIVVHLPLNRRVDALSIDAAEGDEYKRLIARWDGSTGWAWSARRPHSGSSSQPQPCPERLLFRGSATEGAASA